MRLTSIIVFLFSFSLTIWAGIYFPFNCYKESELRASDEKHPVAIVTIVDEEVEIISKEDLLKDTSFLD